MLFSSITFLYYFLPIVLVLYFVVPMRYKNAVLFLCSLLFYGWGEPKNILFMLGAIVAGYFVGLALERMEKQNIRKLVVTLFSMASVGMLVFFKVTILPIGVSFYTFQILSYVLDVYRKTVGAQKNFLYLGTYIAMFPQLIAGPIVRYTDIEKQLKSRTHSFSKVYEGIGRFAIGLGKKVLLANQLGKLCSIFLASEEQSVLFFWINAAAFALQIYFDFSGYSDMAIGLGKIFGFEFMENFRYPYISRSITEFWRRWHISLGSWFRDYVYIPLGGNRKGAGRQIINILVVWALTGFWHGAEWNFVIWGLYFALILIVEKKFLLKKLENRKILSHIYSTILVLLGFVIFQAEGPGQISWQFKGLFGFDGIPLVTAETLYYLKSYAPVMVLGLVGATPIVKDFCKRWKNSILEPIFWIGIMLLSTAHLVNGSFNPFLYFRF